MTTSAVCRSLRRLRRDQRGVTAVIVAITLPVLFAFGALAINSGLWFTIKRENQSAADAAAISAAYELMAGPTGACTNPTFVTDRLTPAAAQAVAANQHVGWDNTGATTTVTCPYFDDLLATEFGAGKYSAVAVTLQQDQSSLFAFAPLASATIATKSVGVVLARDTSCILALGTGNITDVDVVGSASVCLGPLTGTTCGTPTCSISANSTSSSSIHLQGSANVTADTLITPGGNVGFTGGAFTLTLNSPPITFGPPVVDPYAATLTHTFLKPPSGLPDCSYNNSSYTWLPGNCKVAGSSVNGGDILSANTQILGKFAPTGAVHLSAPGTYWITDGDLELKDATLDCPSCTPGGAGVTIILTTAWASRGTVGTLTFGANGHLSVSSPSTGTFAGLAVIQDSNNLPPLTTYTSTTSNAQANSGATINGLVYFPNTDMTFQGTPATGSATCLVLVVKTVTLRGNPGFNSTGCSNAGLSTLPTPQMVVLGE